MIGNLFLLSTRPGEESTQPEKARGGKEMADNELAEAMQLLSVMSPNDILPLLEEAVELMAQPILPVIFDSPAPHSGGRETGGASGKWNSIGARVDRLVAKVQSAGASTTAHLPPIIGMDLVDSIADRIETGGAHEDAPKPEYHWSAPGLGKGVETWLGHLPGKVTDAFKGDGARGPAASGPDGPGGDVPRTHGAAAAIDAWQGAALAGLLDAHALPKGDYKRFASDMGGRALRSGTLGEIQASLREKLCGHGTALDLAVGSGLDAVNLARTGDWARFGKNSGLKLAAGLGTWGGSAGATYLLGGAGAALGLPAVLPVVGALAAGSAARWLVSQVPGISGETRHEHGMREAACPIGAAADKMTQLRDELGSMKSSSPEAFGRFLELLRTAS